VEGWKGECLRLRHLLQMGLGRGCFVGQAPVLGVATKVEEGQ
jgi:hypothetical protein